MSAPCHNADEYWKHREEMSKTEIVIGHIKMFLVFITGMVCAYVLFSA